MAHHGPNPLDALAGLGATGKFPEGHLTKDDEGEIKVAIRSKEGKVVIDFGTPTAWIGFTPEQAVEVAQDLIKHARAVSTKPLTVNL